MNPLNTHSYKFGQFQFEVESLRLLRGSETITLPQKAASLLHLFLQSHGKVIRKDEIFEAIWGNEIVEESNLSQTLYLLRKTLNKYDPTEPFIETLPKIGYRFLADVQEVLPSTAALTTSAAANDRHGAPASGKSVSLITEPQQILTVLESAQHPTLRNAANEATSLRETVWGFVFRQTRIDTNQTAGLMTPTFLHNRKTKLAALILLLALVITCLTLTVAWLLPERIQVNSIAVLPFPELSPDSHESTLGVGVADTVISRLGGLKNIEVRPTAAIRRYTEKLTDPLEAGRALKVEAVLTGNMQRQNGKLRLTAQLLRVSDGKTLWSATFDEQASGLFTLQDKLTEQLIAALQLPLTREEQRRMKKHDTENLAAYQLYLKGRMFWNRRSPEWIRKAIENFEAALKEDQNYAQAYAGLADSYALTTSGMLAAERMPKAKAAVKKALELDDQLAEAHASLGFIKYKFDYDWQGAEESLKQAIELNPNYATAHHWYGELLAFVGRFEE
jgi:DNA-binding winged helix-turn-helix (wHTH) protein/TolB-like protein